MWLKVHLPLSHVRWIPINNQDNFFNRALRAFSIFSGLVSSHLFFTNSVQTTAISNHIQHLFMVGNIPKTFAQVGQ